VLSLWIVDDEGTKNLMTQYYQHLKAGQGRHAALKTAQLALLQDPNTQHPYYWAAFLPSGHWPPLRQ
jgi:CHAT domain-containing protein